jgi:hypothetical protein
MKNIIILAVLVLVAVVAFFVLRDSGEPGVFTQAESQLVAQNWVETTSPTYTFDGMDLTLVSEEVRVPDTEYEYVFTFDSRAAGYGDRSEEMAAQVITPHEIRVVVSSGVVTSVVTDGVYDEMTGQMIEVPAEPTTMTVQVYFVAVEDGQEQIVARDREVTETVAVGNAALEALLAGPTEAELAEGLTTAINDGVVLQDLVIADGVATADFSARLNEDVAGSAMVMAIRGQIEQTLLQFETVNEVVISVDGETEEVLQP